MAPRAITGNLVDIGADPIAGVRVTISRTGVVSQDGDVVLPQSVTITSGAGGALSTELLAGNYTAFARLRNGPARFEFPVPEGIGDLDLADLLEEAQIVQTPDTVLEAREARDDAIAAVAAVPLTRDAYSTVADLLADTILTYSNTVLGQAIWAGGFRYERAASGAPDHHVTTAGGVKLYVLPGAEVDLSAWGVVLDGVADAATALQQAVDIGAATITAQEGSIIGLGSDVTLRSNVRLAFDGCTFKSLSGTKYIDIQGTAGASSDLSADAERLTDSFRAATKSVFSAGDWVCLVNSPNVDNDSGPKGRSQQLVKVVSVDSTNPGYDEIRTDRPLAFKFSIGATPATAHKVTAPIENVSIAAKAFIGVTTRPKLAINCNISVSDSGETGAVQMANENPIACLGGSIVTTANAETDASSGASALIMIRSWHELIIRIVTYGGAEDGVRLYNCTDVFGYAIAKSYAARGVWLYKNSGNGLFVAAENGRITTGNVEHVLLDYCEDLELTPRALNFQSGEGIELRGRIRNICLSNPIVIPRVGSTVANCIFVHPASAGQICENVRIIGGYCSGSVATGLQAPDGVDGLLVDGLRCEPHAGATTFAPCVINVDGGFEIAQNITIRNSTFIAAGVAPLSVFGSSSLIAKRVKFIDNTLSVPSALSSFFLGQYVDDFEVSGTRYVSAPAAVEARVWDCTKVRMSGNERPSERFRYDFTSSVLLDADNLMVRDTPISALASAMKPRVLDSFTDADATAIASHVPEVGGFTWLETSGPNATILSNRLRITTNGNLVYTDAGLKNFDAFLGVFYVTATTVYSFVFDWSDASNFAEVEFNSNANTIRIVETVGGSATALSTYSSWPGTNNVEEAFRVRVVGPYVEVFRGEVRIASASLTSLNGATVVGWKRISASTNESVLSAIAIVGL